MNSQKLEEAQQGKWDHQRSTLLENKNRPAPKHNIAGLAGDQSLVLVLCWSMLFFPAGQVNAGLNPLIIYRL